MTGEGRPRPFLTAEWRHLVMLNYRVDPDVLRPFQPRGTELDTWQGDHYVSVVAFRFLDTRVRGMAIPCHRNFDEINLRFYVGRKAEGEWRRGVVFIKEVVPRWAIAAVARRVYNERYVACPTRSMVRLPAGDGVGTLRYAWRPRGLQDIAVTAEVTGAPTDLEPGSDAEFITEHYWGYAVQRDGSTVEYRVEHPRWRVWEARAGELTGPAATFYGGSFGAVLNTRPSSMFVAEGSPVSVHRGQRLNVNAADTETTAAERR